MSLLNRNYLVGGMSGLQSMMRQFQQGAAGKHGMGMNFGDS